MAGYTRNDVTSQIADGNVINAGPLNGEFDAIESAFNALSGHKHDGTSAEGAPITVIGPVQDLVASASVFRPKTDNVVDLGTSTLEFKDLWIDGTANIDNLVADAGTVAGAAITTVSNSQTLTNKTLSSPIISGAVTQSGTNSTLILGGINRWFIDATSVRALGNTTESQTLLVGSGRTGDGTSSINLVADSTGAGNLSFTAYAGAGGIREIRNLSSGAFQVVNTGASPIIFTNNNTERLRITPDGEVVIGTSSPTSGAFVDISSTTGGLALPRLTTTQRDAIASPSAGVFIYNTTLNAGQVRIGAAWESLAVLASPAFTGTPTAPTAAAGTNTTQLATTAHVFAERTNTATLTNKTINLANNTLTATSAQIAAAVSDETGTGALVFASGPALTGVPTAPTAAVGTNTTQIATTAHVFAERASTATLTNKTLTAPVINGGSISGITDLAIADGGTGASTALAALVNLGAAPVPTNAATVGQLVPIFAATNTALLLPAGGTWAFFGFLQDNTSGTIVPSGLFAGVAAGGTSIGGPVVNAQGFGFAWRIA